MRELIFRNNFKVREIISQWLMVMRTPTSITGSPEWARGRLWQCDTISNAVVNWHTIFARMCSRASVPVDEAQQARLPQM